MHEWNRAVELLPNSSAALSGRGFCLISLKKDAEAMSDLKKSAELDPRNEYAQRGLAVLAERRGDLNAAVLHYRTPAEMPPRYNTDRVWKLEMKIETSNAYWARANNRYEQGDLPGAFEDTLTAVEFNQKSGCPPLWKNLLVMTLELPAEKVAAANEKLRSSISRFRDRPEYLFARDVVAAVFESIAGAA